MKIGIAGVGGIGSNVAVYMVRSGIEQLKLVDFDRVEPGNLNRQFYFRDQVGSNKVDMLACNLRRINPSVKIDALMLKLDRTNMAACFADCDTVVEGLDGRRDKKNLLEALAGSGKPVISACGIAGCGTDGQRHHRRRFQNRLPWTPDLRSQGCRRCRHHGRQGNGNGGAQWLNHCGRRCPRGSTALPRKDSPGDVPISRWSAK